MQTDGSSSGVAPRKIRPSEAQREVAEHALGIELGKLLKELKTDHPGAVKHSDWRELVEVSS